MEIFGDFKYEAKTSVYKFIVSRVITWTFYGEVLRVVGDHVEGKTSKDVDAISISSIELKRFPRLIGRFFPNLKAMTINSCGLKGIEKSDLLGLTSLTQLTLNGNEITELPNDLFHATPQLEAVSFYGNQIEFIGANIFDFLPHLTYANFKLNVNIDDCFKSFGFGVSLHELKDTIQVHCQHNFEENCVADDGLNFEQWIRIVKWIGSVN